MSDDEQPSLFDEPRSLPYISGSDTSRAAAISMEEFAHTCRARVYKHIFDAGARGKTYTEIINELGMAQSTVNPRLVDLQRMKLIVKSGTTRLTSPGHYGAVYIVNPEADR